MATATFSVRMESDTKKELDAICSKFGMTTSVAINIFARTVVREKRIPFEISLSRENTTGLNAFNKLRADAEKKGMRGMSIDEINEEIKSARDMI